MNKRFEPDEEIVTPFSFVLARDITLEPKEFLIDGFVGVGETSAWYGPPDCGKSTVVIDAGCHVAAAIDYCGHQVKRGAVLYVAIERGAVVKRRVLAWCRHHEQEDIPLAVVSECIDLRTSELDADRIIATAKEFSERVGLPVVWIILDTLNRALAGGDENASKDMGALIASVDRINRESGAHCTLVHHVPVDRTDRMRGHSSVLGAVDLTVRVTKNDKIVSVEVDKANDLTEKPAFVFQFQSVELSSEGTSVTTAPVLIPCDAGTAKQRGPKLSPTAYAGLRALHECLAECGQKSTSARAPAGSNIVTMEQWKDHLLKRGLINPKGNYREQFRRIHVALSNAGVIAIWGEEVWAV